MRLSVVSLHDRKLCVLGLCTLLQMNGGRPQALSECAPQIIPSLILLFDGLKRAYAAKAQECEEESEDESDDDDQGIVSFLISLSLSFIFILVSSVHGMSKKAIFVLSVFFSTLSNLMGDSFLNCKIFITFIT